MNLYVLKLGDMDGFEHTCRGKLVEGLRNTIPLGPMNKILCVTIVTASNASCDCVGKEVLSQRSVACVQCASNAGCGTALAFHGRIEPFGQLGQPSASTFHHYCHNCNSPTFTFWLYPRY